MSSLQIGFIGGAFGVAAGASIALAVMVLVPEFGHAPRLAYLWGDFCWAVFFSSPFGFAMGAVMIGYLLERARDVKTFRQLVIESLLVMTALATVIAQFAIPSTWALPRLKITAIIVLGACTFSVIGAWLLRPIYWRRR